MSNPRHQKIIAQTRKWIIDVVVGCNFCPFALREVRRESLGFEVLEGNRAFVLDKLSAAFGMLHNTPEIETHFLLLPQQFNRFSDFLKLVGAAEGLVRKQGYEGIFQLANFHPDYLFAGSRPDDAANFTNRSPYPMLQLLREESVSRAVERYPDTTMIPKRNIAFARSKGVAYLQALRAACMDADQ